VSRLDTVTLLTPKQLTRYLKKQTQAAIEHGTVIGVEQYTGATVVLDDKDANLHTLAVGTTGSGSFRCQAFGVKS